MDIDKEQVLQLCVTLFFIPQHLFSKLYSYLHICVALERIRALENPRGFDPAKHQTIRRTRVQSHRLNARKHGIHVRKTFTVSGIYLQC